MTPEKWEQLKREIGGTYEIVASLPDISDNDSTELHRLCEQSAREVKLAGGTSAATSLEMIAHMRRLEIALRGLKRVNSHCYCLTWTGGEHEPECITATEALAVFNGK